MEFFERKQIYLETELNISRLQPLHIHHFQYKTVCAEDGTHIQNCLDAVNYDLRHKSLPTIDIPLPLYGYVFVSRRLDFTKMKDPVWRIRAECNTTTAKVDCAFFSMMCEMRVRTTVAFPQSRCNGGFACVPCRSVSEMSMLVEAGRNRANRSEGAVNSHNFASSTLVHK
ncbi:hypothetical protein T440DRAFT_473065 [Plenodomus tracheiphilus IPT5]|uniref:Uncharacterized protein n=1 Tax=Plenodomus tracheiphilus IPT5 TaxID=1408161 RepID=A0A6A7ARC2_9PLEO|nr:hypothetical protein T440DRAFT_473065 [Plenodomus tracheiphilus IPT5]